MKKLLTSSQIKKLSPEQLIKYKKELAKYCLKELKPHVEEFYELYKFLKQEMATRAEFLETLASFIEEQRLEASSGEESPHLFTIQ